MIKMPDTYFKLGRKRYVQMLLVVLCCALYYDTALGDKVSPPEDECAAYDTCEVLDFFRTCSCDEDCYRYGTCCFNADAAAKKVKSAEDFECYSDRIPQSVFMKKTCSSEFAGERDIVNACEQDTQNWSDLMANVLVSSNETWTTYKNWNCALCNNENVKNLWFWIVKVSYSIPAAGRRLAVRSFRQNFTYDEDLEKWGIYGENGRFVKCSVEFNQPAILNGKLRYCADEVISQCHANWNGNEEIRRNCSLYYGERKMKNEKKYFKNVHCALCNGLDISDLECFGRHYWATSGASDISLAKVVYDLNIKIGEQDWPSCRSRKRYDPFLKECRSVNTGLKDISLEPDDTSDPNGVQMHPVLTIYNLIITLVCIYINKK